MKQRLLMLLMMLVSALQVAAQNIEVTGRVTSAASGNAAEGITVTVKGTQRGTTTNATGFYAIRAGIGETLVFSGIGFTSREAAITSKTLDLSLEGVSGDLGEVVVVGYGTQRKSNLTGSQVNLNNAAITRRQVTSTSTK